MELEVVRIDEGGRDNWLVRQGEVAGHVVVTAGRLIVSFPAGNEAAGLWFHPAPQRLRVEEAPSPWSEGELRGLRLVLRHQGALRPARVFLGSARVVRELDEGRSVAAREALMGPLGPEREERAGGEVIYRRDHLDGRHRTELSLRSLGEGAVEVRVGTSWPPLTPIPRSRLLSERGRRLIDETSEPLRRRSLERALDVLAYLSYEEALLAGSWRFDTYFGRDTIMTLRLLAPVLRPEVCRWALDSVLRRVGPEGEVPHEEELGEQAIFRHLEAAAPRSRWGEAVTVHDMIDEDFMLLPLARQLGVDPDEPALARNRRRVLELARRGLRLLAPGAVAGDWRDSAEGLGGGRAPYSVNAVLVQASLEALGERTPSELVEWWRRARQAFVVRRSVDEVRRAAARALSRFNADERRALRRQPLPGGGRVGAFVDGGPPPPPLRRGLEFHALALDEAGDPIAVMHSDDAFALLDLPLPPAEVEATLPLFQLPFPLGLRTEAGLLVANPTYSDREGDLEIFDRTHYHGAVVWGWHHQLLLAGLLATARRLEARASVDRASARAGANVRRCLAEIEALDRARSDLSGAELWSWAGVGGRVRPRAYGGGDDMTESNAAQLWSAAGLGVAADLRDDRAQDNRGGDGRVRSG